MANTPNETSPGRRVDELLRGLDIQAATAEQVASTARAVAALGRDGVAYLARSVFRPGPSRREKVAALLACLEGEEAGWALGELGKLANSRTLSAMERVWLLTVLQSLEGAAAAPGSRGEAAPATQEPDAQQGLAIDEMQLLLWRDELAGLEPDDQEAALAPVLHSGDPSFLPLLEMAVSLGSPRLDAAVADGLAQFATAEALPLVRQLLQSPDPVVRKHARASLLALERQGVDARGVFVATAETNEPVVAVRAMLPDHTGQMAVVVARGHGAMGIRYAVVVIDPVEAGIVRAWGEANLSEADLDDRLIEFADESGQELYQAELNTVQALVAEAERFARQQGHAMPPDYIAFRRLIGSPTGPAELPVAFAPNCAECGERFRGRDTTRGGFIAGPVALCAKCAEKPRHCAICGRALHRIFDEFLVRTGGASVEFICLPCGRKRGRGG